ncbi:hypothetical protein RB195_023437 [Necator americanus]|uniref:Uncharacterized protein n=1 Tax=Necator americanus TaxID=51031 RepID=A0ABR1EJR8_NECAM
MLLNRSFIIEYINTKDYGQVDALSRLVSSKSLKPEDYVIASIDADVTSEFSENCCHFPVFAESIRTASQADRPIQLVIDYTKSGKWAKVSRHTTAEIP